MRISGRAEPLPNEMQGTWVASDDPSVKLSVRGAEVICFGRAIEYDYKEIHEVDGALTVSLKVNDEAQEDSFQRSNVTGLVITPEGEFHAYNVKFASHFVRPHRKEMEPTDDERAVRQRKWQSAREKLREMLGAVGLVEERDYRFHGEDWPQYGTGVEVRDESLMTADFLVACRQALSDEGEWAAVVGVRDPTRNNNMRSIVEISSGLFTAITGGEVTRQAIFEAYHKVGLGHLLWWPKE